LIQFVVLIHRQNFLKILLYFIVLEESDISFSKFFEKFLIILTYQNNTYYYLLKKDIENKWLKNRIQLEKLINKRYTKLINKILFT